MRRLISTVALAHEPSLVMLAGLVLVMPCNPILLSYPGLVEPGYSSMKELFDIIREALEPSRGKLLL